MSLQQTLLFILLCFFSAQVSASDLAFKDSNTTYSIRYTREVNFLLKQINPTEMLKNLNSLTHFPDRAANHQTGLSASDWLQNELAQLIATHHGVHARIFTIETKGYDWGDQNSPFASPQPSIVLQIGSAIGPAIIVGAYFDTVGCLKENCVGEANLPGADDDGSGTVTLMELARTLLASSMHFKKPIYLIWYAAEEQGLLGSQSVVAHFQANKIPVAAVMQLDQVGYAMNNDLTLYLESDQFLEPDHHAHVDYALTLFLQELAIKYVGRKTVLSCGGSSDNEAWVDLAHVKAVRPLESNYCNEKNPMNPYTHQPEDTIDKLSLTHMTDYLKLAIAFTVELAEPINT